MRRLICFLMFIAFYTASQAIVFQDNNSVIKGKVTDIAGSPLPGAGITIESTLLGVYTNSEGNYSLPVLKDGLYILRFSFLGYESTTREVRLKGDAVLNITLLAKSFMTEEVFVNATRAGEHTP